MVSTNSVHTSINVSQTLHKQDNFNRDQQRQTIIDSYQFGAVSMRLNSPIPTHILADRNSWLALCHRAMGEV